jgi:hypothetical protein
VHQVLQLVHRQRLAVALGLDERGDEIVAGLGAALLELAGEVVLGADLDFGLLERFLDGEAAVGARQHGVGPALERRVFRGVEPELLADDDPGQREGELPDELAFAVVDERVDQLIGDLVNARFKRVDPPEGGSALTNRRYTATPSVQNGVGDGECC